MTHRARKYPEYGPSDEVVAKTTSVRSPDNRFSVRGFRFHRQWAVDVDYLRRLGPEEREWMQRFLAEYYDADNKLLRPEKHPERCRTCREGGDCGKRPPPALHGTTALRRECYNLQARAYYDVHSRGQVALWEDFDGVDETGRRRNDSRVGRTEGMLPRLAVGDVDGDGPGDSSSLVNLRPMRRFKRGR